MADEYDDTESSGYSGAPGLALVGLGNQFTTPEAKEYAETFLKSMDPSGEGEEIDAYMAKIRAQNEAARNALRAARAKIEAQKENKAALWFAASAGLGSPTRTGSLGESAANFSKAIAEPYQNLRDRRVLKDKQLFDIDSALARADESELTAQLEIMKMRQDMQGRMGVKALDIMGRPLHGSGTGKTQIAAIQAGDRAYAPLYAAWSTEGGSASAQKGLDDLEKASEMLAGRIDPETGQPIKPDAQGKYPPPKNMTGKVVGTIGKLPKIGDWAQNILAPGAANVRQLVEYTIQNSLRPILGAQFTETEGERLINRVYNPMLPEPVNADRVRTLRQTLIRMKAQKDAAAAHWEKYRTLGPTVDNPKGFQGLRDWGRITVDDLVPMGSLPGDDQIPKTPRASWRDKPEDDPWEGNPVIDYESLVPAGAPLDRLSPEEEAQMQGRARGGKIKKKKKKRPIMEYSGFNPDLDRLIQKIEKKARGGGVRRFAEGGVNEMVQYSMPDGRIINAPANVPEEIVRARYMASQGLPMESSIPAPGDEVPLGESSPVVNETDPLDLGASVVGHGALGALGGWTASKMAQKGADLIPGHRVTPAQSKVLGALENEQKTPQDLLRDMTQQHRRGVPANMVDVGGLEMRALAEQSMNPANQSTRDFHRELIARQKGAPGRVEEQVNKALKPDPYIETMNQLRSSLKTNSRPLYTTLYAKYPAVKSKELFQIMKTPSGEKAVARAVKSIQDRPGATIGKQDALGMVTKPSLEFLDQVKEELDDMITKEETKNGVYTSTRKGKRLRELRKAFRDELDAATMDPKSKISAYKEARSQYAGDLEIMDALRYGREEFSKVPPDAVQEFVKDLNFSEKDALRSGVAQGLFDQLGKVGTKGNPAEKIIGTPAQLEKLSYLFDKPKEFEIFKAALEAEARIHEESAGTIRKGRSQIMTMKDPKENILRRTARDVPLRLFSPTSWAIRYLRRSEGIKPAEADAIIKMLKTATPAEMKKLESTLTPKVGRMATRKKFTRGAAAAGALGAAALPLYREYMKQEEEEPIQKARGGLVKRPQWVVDIERSLSSSMYGGDDMVSSLIR